MNIIDLINIITAAFFGIIVFCKFRRDMKYEIRDKSIEIRLKKLKRLYQMINA